jgi:hypothetical protein
MTVSASAKDPDGRLLQANIAALQTAVNAAFGKAHYAALSAQLDQLQRESVYHFLDTGRLTAANILSTMT